MISPPNYQKDAIPTPQGWRHPRTNELLVSRPISKVEIDEYHGISPTPEVQMLKESPTTVEEVKEEMFTDTLSSDVEYERMSKDELEEVGREHGIELDKRHSHADLVDELEDHMSSKSLESMTKVELEELGREHGIELDRRKKKADLIEELNEVI